MRINSIHAIAFSHLVDQSLELADGMTIAIGANETGKSSWHAAIYAALCGKRRGPGNPTFDRAFKQRHAPWDTSEWEVECTVTLQDGAELEIRHELEDHLNCHIVNRVTGEDLSSDHMNDQCPDGARLLGLSRDIMWATLFVRQANIIRDLSGASGLQEALQRAADAGEERATATRAIVSLEEHMKTVIGTTRAPTKPLMTAHREVEAARAALDDAIEKKEGLADLHVTLSQLNHKVEGLENVLGDLESWAAYVRLTELQERAERIQVLSGGFPEMTPPPPSDDLDHTIDRVEGALAEWRGLPETHELPGGPSASDLADQIDALPPQPDEDTEPAQEVVDAHTNLLELTAIAEASIREPEIDLPEGVEEATSPSELRSLAADLELTTGAKPIRPGKWPMWAVGAGVVLLVASIAMLAGDVTALGLVLLVLGFLMTVGGGIPLLLARLAEPASPHMRADDARRRTDDLRIAAEPAGLRQLAADLERKLGSYVREDQESKVSQLTTAQNQLIDLLEERGISVGSSETIDDAVQRYRQECSDRAVQASEAERKPDLENQLEARKQLEEQFAVAENLRIDSETRLEEVASLLEIERISPTAVFVDEIY
jgi:DNA repair protein SbcC/Rad50